MYLNQLGCDQDVAVLPGAHLNDVVLGFNSGVEADLVTEAAEVGRVEDLHVVHHQIVAAERRLE